MRTATYRTRLTVVGACAAAIVLPACTKQTSVAPPTDGATSADASAPGGGESANELNWARAALQRNPTIEIVATDTNAGVFTIRSKDTGEIRAVKASELAAVPVSFLTATMRTADATDAQPDTTASRAEPTGKSAAETGPAVAGSRTAASMPNYTIERTSDQVRVSGPGVSIVSTGGAAGAAAETPKGERSAEPIICEGRRMLHFDNRNIYVEGDAIVARGGCELHITNSRVAASGTGIVVGDATVHIANSTIEGSAASFDAGDGAKVYVRGSTFEGLPRRTASAVVQDQGGNQWR